jgi:hypothetical protein
LMLTADSRMASSAHRSAGRVGLPGDAASHVAEKGTPA